MRKSDTFVGAALFVAIALAMPLAALEPVAADAGKGDLVRLAAGACGSKLAAVCDRGA
ncbi:MAG: hypothetical protein JO013_03285 [Alphaproteobacteria bacterium]|nr:hypothetical protein [Alphaproteobacteria bacterium]